MKNIVTFVLGGGRGTRLYPLTKLRSKPAVPVAGKYRLIDIPLSNCINSGLNRIYVLTQFNSVSLHRHIRSTYVFDPFNRGFVEILAAQQTLDNTDWYQGTADAVRQNLRHLTEPGVEHVLILSGDQLYRMNFRDMIATHRASGADVTISAVPVTAAEASSMGIMRVDAAGRVVGFLEKPQTPAETRSGPHRPGLDRRPGRTQPRPRLPGQHGHLPLQSRYAGSTPWRRRTTATSARRSSPPPCAPTTCRSTCSTATGRTSARSSRSTRPICSWPPSTRPSTWPRPRPPSTPAPASCRPRASIGPRIRQSLVADGCRIEEGAVIENSIIGLRCLIGRNVTIRNSILMGNDYLRAARRPGHRPQQRRRAAGRGRRNAHRRGHHRQELPHRPRRPRGQRPGPRSHRGDRVRHDPRRTWSW